MNREEYDEALYLAHHGVKGQKWGHRRYQNEDGSYKSGAEGRYAPDPQSSSSRSSRKDAKNEYKAAKKAAKAARKTDLDDWNTEKEYDSSYTKWYSNYGKAKAAELEAKAKFENSKSEGSRKAVKAHLKAEGQKKYNELFDKFSKKMDDPLQARELAKAGQKKYEEKLKQKMKSEKESEIRKAVKTFQAAMDRASKTADDAYDRHEAEYSKANGEWDKAMEMRKGLGKTRIGRAITAGRGKTEAAKAYSKQADKAVDMMNAADDRYRASKEKSDAQFAKALELRKKTGKTKLGRVINNIRYGN